MLLQNPQKQWIKPTKNITAQFYDSISYIHYTLHGYSEIWPVADAVLFPQQDHVSINCASCLSRSRSFKGQGQLATVHVRN